MFLLLFFSFILIGCTNNASGNTEGSEKEIEDGELTESGQWKEDDDGTIVTLKKMSDKEINLDLTPIEMIIHDVKLLEFNSDDEYINNVIQIMFTIENKSDKEIMFNGIDVITTDTRKQMDVYEENIADEYVSGEFYGEVEKEGHISVVYPEESFDDLEEIELITSDVWDNNHADKIHEAITKEISF